jgi:hypothetical protein
MNEESAGGRRVKGGWRAERQVSGAGCQVSGKTRHNVVADQKAGGREQKVKSRCSSF